MLSPEQILAFTETVSFTVEEVTAAHDALPPESQTIEVLTEICTFASSFAMKPVDVVKYAKANAAKANVQPQSIMAAAGKLKK